MQLFDTVLANELYSLLIGPVDTLVKDKGHFLVAPSGTLTAPPFHLLVTEKPATGAAQIQCRLGRALSLQPRG